MFGSNKESQIAELKELVKEITSSMNKIIAQADSGVDNSVRNAIQTHGAKLNRAYSLKREIGSKCDTLIVSNGFSDVSISSFFFNQKMCVRMIESGTRISFNLNF